jgi:ABC-2 type transport system permease protein
MTTAAVLPRIGTAQQSWRGLIDSEWIKLRTARSTHWTVGIIAAMMLVMAATMAITQEASGPADAAAVASMAAGGVTGAQFAAMVLGTFAITGEYRTGQIRSTFNADPTRLRVLTAKAAVVALTTFLSGLVSSLVAFVVAHVALAVTGHGAASLVSLDALRIMAGAATYLTFTAVISLALGAALRRSAAAITTVLALLWMLPGTAVILPGAWAGAIVSFMPAAAGAALYASSYDAGEMDIFSAMTPAGGIDLAPWQGLATLLVYLAAISAVAATAIRRKDV